MTKRITAFLLCVLMLVTLLPGVPVLATNSSSSELPSQEELIITSDGVPVSEIVISPYEGAKLTAQSNMGTLGTCRWQILVDAQSDLWVDIYGENEPELTVRYAMVLSLLNHLDEAWIRCVRKNGAGEIASEAVCVVVDFLAEYPGEFAAAADQAQASSGGILSVDTVPGRPAQPMDMNDPVDETLKKYILSIDYVYADDSIHAGNYVAPSWSAEISALQAYKAEIKSPTIPGYTPDQAVYKFEYEANQLTSNVQITIRYSPSNVGYTVKHFWQNVDNDYYTQHEVESFQGKTESAVPDTLDEDGAGGCKYPGFESLPYVVDTIAADGSTTVEIYYDRIYYLMDFELDGGYGLYPIYARYGAPISVDIPVKAGYQFDGWRTDKDQTTVDIPDTMPVGGGTYYAKWTPLNAKYTVSYWIVNEDGTRSLLGFHIDYGAVGSTVSGTDNLGTEEGYICREESTHQHSDECCKMGKTEHKHTKDCFSDEWKPNVPGAEAEAAIAAIDDGTKNPESGYIYIVNNLVQNTKNFWPKLYLEDENGKGQYYWISNYYGTEADVEAKLVEGDALGTGEAANHRAKKYLPKTTCGYEQHIHSEDCFACDEHVHDSEECYIDTKYMEYIAPDATDSPYTTDENILIKGDGTSVVNIYYRYKEYTLKFYYAATVDGNPRVVGGSTYYFGGLDGTKSPDDGVNLANEWWHQELWGTVTELPTLNDKGTARNYTKGSVSYKHTDRYGTTSEVTYHYISFKARFGDDISEMWPCDVFNSVTRTDSNTHGNWTGTEAFVSAWNGESQVEYSKNDNQTIKGVYEVLDETILFASEYPDAPEVSYLCFWENGANVSWSVPKLFRYNVYLETYWNQNTTGLTTKTQDGKTYYLADSYDTCDDSNPASQTQTELRGFEKAGYTDGKIKDYNTTLYSDAYDMNFFYNRKKYTLTFWNHDDYLSDGTGADVPYGEPLKLRFNGDKDNLGANQRVLDKYPVTLEPGAYEFEGWYLSPNFESDTRVDPETMTMPAENLMVYAHWVPKTHKVNVYRYKNADGTFPTEEVNILKKDLQIPHGSTVPEKDIPEDPVNGTYTFDGWFYIDGTGKEQAFDFHKIPVDRDLNIYAKWKSDMLKTVTVRYVTIKDGTEVEIAPPETYSAYVGTLKTYEAKVDDQLYEGYRTGYYPKFSSRSITVSEGENVLVFEYENALNVPYEVRYWIEDENGTRRPAFRNKDGNPEFVGDTTISDAEAYTKTVKDNKRSVVTENYIRVDSYVPDALQKRLILTTVDAQNVIDFIYVYDPNQAYYTVNHYILKPGKTSANSPADYDLYTSSEILGNVGETYASNPITIPGTTFSEDITKSNKGTNSWDTATRTLSAKLAKDNVTTLNFYYTRDSYPYRVRYLDAETGLEVLPTKTKDDQGNQLTAQYGIQITETAPTVNGYKVDENQKSHTINIGDMAANTITFYYTRLKGDLEISKTVVLDPDQLAEDPGLTLPDGAETQPFVFVVSSNDPFYKQSFDYTIYRGDGTEEMGTVSVALASMNKVLSPIQLCHGERIVIHGLALGQYKVTELPTVGYKATINNTETEQVTLNLQTEHAKVQANVTNTYPFFTGDLVLSKKVKKDLNTDPSGNGEIFMFHITIVPEQGTLEEDRVIRYKTLDTNGDSVEKTYTISAEDYDSTHQFTLLLKAETTVTVQDVPVGDFTVLETIDQEHYATDYYHISYDKKTGKNVTVIGKSEQVNGVILGGRTTWVDYTNTYKKGNLTIRKTVELEVPYDSWESDVFLFQVTGTTSLPDGSYDITIDGQPGKANVTNGQVTLTERISVQVSRDGGWSNSVLIKNLPAGLYHVAETGAGEHGDRLNRYTVTPSDKIISDLKLPGTDDSTTAAFANLYKRTTGNLTISKEIHTVVGGAELDPNQEFVFTVSMPGDWTGSETSYTGKHSIDGERTITRNPDGTFSVKLKDGESVTFEGMPIGVYTVVETPVVGYEGIYQITNGNDDTLSEIRVFTEQTTTVNCVNLYPVYIGKLTITKTNAADEEQVFVYEVKNTDTDETITVTVVGNGSTTIQNLPYGNYTVTQLNDWSWRYADGAQTLKLGVDGEAGSKTVSFNDVRTNKKWLDGNSMPVENHWKKKEEEESEE